MKTDERKTVQPQPTRAELTARILAAIEDVPYTNLLVACLSIEYNADSTRR